MSKFKNPTASPLSPGSSPVLCCRWAGWRLVTRPSSPCTRGSSPTTPGSPSATRTTRWPHCACAGYRGHVSLRRCGSCTCAPWWRLTAAATCARSTRSAWSSRTAASTWTCRPTSTTCRPARTWWCRRARTWRWCAGPAATPPPASPGAARTATPSCAAPPPPGPGQDKPSTRRPKGLWSCLQIGNLYGAFLTSPEYWWLLPAAGLASPSTRGRTWAWRGWAGRRWAPTSASPATTSRPQSARGSASTSTVSAALS